MSAELGVGYVGVSFPFDTGGGYSGHLGNDTRVILSGLDIERTAHFGSGLDSVNAIFLAVTEQVQVEVDQQSVRSDTPPQFRWNTELKFMPAIKGIKNISAKIYATILKNSEFTSR